MSKKREFLDLISIEEAQVRIRSKFHWKPQLEEIPLVAANGRILARDVTAKIDTPPFDRSLMDGVAVRAEDTFGIEETEPRAFQIIETVPAGKIAEHSLEDPFTCIEIATGAPIPRGADAVVMVEYTSKVEGEKVKIYRSITPYENIDPAGSDMMLGETILRENDQLTPVRLGILAALGHDRVPVWTRLRVGILSSGDELRLPGELLPLGCLYDSNSIVLIELVEECGAHSQFLGICPDSMRDFKEILTKHLDSLDIILISGGTSAGEGDFSYRVISELGGSLLFHGISMKPGKPLAAGLIVDTLILTLPGFPASSIFSFSEVIAPLICQWTKTPRPQGHTIQAKLGQRFRSTPGRTHFRLVHILKQGENYRVFPVKGNSGSVSMLERGDGYIIIPAEIDYLSPGTQVSVSLLRQELLIPDIVFIGSHDILVDLLFNDFRNKHPQYITKLIPTGSTGGLAALKQGACDISGIHLLDTSTRKYNVPFLETWQLKEKITLIKAYKRIQGLYVPKSNPKGINGLEDLISSDIVFLNRNEGSGTRVLFDSLLEDVFKNQSISQQINGYSSVAHSHSATASSVKHGKVDVAMGIQYYADYFGLDFIPLVEEEYDFIIINSSLEKPAIKALLTLFSSPLFRKRAETQISDLKWAGNRK